MKRKQGIALLVIFGLLFQLFLPSVLADSNGNVEISDETNLITSIQMYTNPTNNGERTDQSADIEDVRIHLDEKLGIWFEWELEQGHTFSSGDTFTFSLPDKFIDGIELDGYLVSEEDVIGSYTVSSDGEVVFTFNEEINNGQGYTGSFYVY